MRWKTLPGENEIPKCPQCGSAKAVRKGTLYHRKFYPPARRYICCQCTPKGSSGFLKESEKISSIEGSRHRDEPPCPRCGQNKDVRRAGFQNRESGRVPRYRCKAETCRDFAAFISEADKQKPDVPPDISCPRCRSNQIARDGIRNLDADRCQYYRCAGCGLRKFVQECELIAPRKSLIAPLGEATAETSVPVPEFKFGRWDLPEKRLQRGLSLMFQDQNRCLPDWQAMDQFVTEMVKSLVNEWLLVHQQELMRSYARPIAKPCDPLRQIQEYIIDGEPTLTANGDR